MDVPTATFFPTDASTQPTPLSGLCPLMGFSIPLGHTTLHALYPSHAAYLARVSREANELVRRGFWVASDGAQVLRQAAATDIL